MAMIERLQEREGIALVGAPKPYTVAKAKAEHVEQAVQASNHRA
jgi:hypothetical protein